MAIKYLCNQFSSSNIKSLQDLKPLQNYNFSVTCGGQFTITEGEKVTKNITITEENPQEEIINTAIKINQKNFI